eukprot:6221997-Amphidinium_carterae.1
MSDMFDCDVIALVKVSNICNNTSGIIAMRNERQALGGVFKTVFTSNLRKNLGCNEAVIWLRCLEFPSSSCCTLVPRFLGADGEITRGFATACAVPFKQ